MLVIPHTYRWDGYVFHQYAGGNKARWLICIGRNGILSGLSYFHLATTTTSYHSDKISQNAYFKIDQNKYTFFDSDCFIYFQERIFTLQQIEIEQHKEKIEFKGVINSEDMQKIYLGYWTYKTIPPVDLKEIKFSLENIGVKELPDPKKNL
ncbi:hypothetical protein [Leptospira mayottensis]|uniref:hypothetical protein n=1 Tax=Leptospira mayottensis TaxID=1137606 RepID=UPI001F491FD0|nr:hypothetical protein [Leptospira mayottensis]